MTNKIVLNDALGTYDVTQINANFQKIEDALNNSVMYRSNPAGTPNMLGTDLDMNGKRLINLAAPISDNDPVRLLDFKTASGITPNLVLVNVKDYGAVGNGVADDTAAFNAWSTVVTANGAGIVPVGVYNLPNGFNAPSNATVFCSPGSVLDLSKGTDSAIGIKAYGSVGASYAVITAPAIYGNTISISAVDAANFAVDDYIEIYSDDVADIANRTDTPIGEMVKIKAISSGTITIYGALKVPNQYVTNPKIKKITFFENLEWYGGEIRGRITGTDPAQIGFYSKYARNINTYGVFTNQTMGIGHLWESSYNCWANSPRSVDNRRPFSGYSVAVGYTSQFCGGKDGDFLRSRHAFTTTGGTSGHGIPINCGIYNTRSRYAIGDDFDTHSIGINIDILDCISEYAEGSAVNIECQSANVRVRAVKPTQHGVAISNYAKALGAYNITFNVVDAGGSILRIDPGTVPASQYGLKKVLANLEGNSVGSAVDILWTSAVPTKASNVKIAGNVTSAVASTAVSFLYCQDFDASGLKVTCTGLSPNGIKMDHCDGGTVAGAQADLPSGSSGASFYVNACNNIDLRSTRGRSVSPVNSKAITVDSSSSNCQFGEIANRFIGYTTVLNAGLGSGHTGSVNGSVTYDPPSLAAGAVQQTSVTVSGANVGDHAEVAFSIAHTSIRWSGEVTLANNVTVTQENIGGGAVDLASGTLKAIVIKLA